MVSPVIQRYLILCDMFKNYIETVLHLSRKHVVCVRLLKFFIGLATTVCVNFLTGRSLKSVCVTMRLTIMILAKAFKANMKNATKLTALTDS